MALLFTLPRVSTFDLTGAIAGSSRLYFYDTLTATPRPVYADSALSQPLTQPVTSSDGGTFPAIYLDDSLGNYKVVCRDANDAELWTVDPYLSGPSQAQIGAALYPLSIEFEQPVGLTTATIDRRYPLGQLERYLLVGDGSTDDAAAFANAALVSAQGVKLFGTDNAVYRCESAVPVGAYFDLDLRGGKVKPIGNTQLFTRNSTGTPATSSGTVSSGATEGSRSLVMSSAPTSFAIGQYCIFDSSDANYQSGSWPCNWSTITDVSGTTVEIDRPLGCEYETTVTMYVYNPSLFGELFRIKGQIDMAQSTYASNGSAIDISGYKLVDLRDCEIPNPLQSNIATTTVQTLSCLDVFLSGRASRVALAGNVWDIAGSRSVHVTEFDFDGAGFGLNVYRASDVVINGAIMNGRRTYEVAESVTATRSIRAIKLIGCLDSNITNVSINDFSSPIKLESNRRVNISNFTIRNACPEAGDIACNFSGFGTSSKQKGGNISNFNISSLAGTGAAIGFNNPDTGRYKVTNGTIRKVAQNAIYAESSNFIVCSDLDIEDWGTTSGTGIRADGGGSFQNITFRNSDNTKVCFSTPASGKTYYFGGIHTPDANPIFASSKKFRDSGTASIASAATSVVVTHNLVSTPGQADIDVHVTNSSAVTNNIGALRVHTITSTQFTIACLDPGASGVDFAWSANLCKNGPFTMP